MRTRSLPVFAVLLLAATSVQALEWPQFHADSLHSGSVASNFAPPNERWWSASTGGPIEGSPVVSDGRVFIGSTDGKLYAYDALSGSLLWTFDSGNPISSTPALSGGVIYLVNNDGHLFAIDAVTGKKRLSAGTGNPDPGPTRTSPTLHEGRLFIGTEAGTLIAYSQQTLTKDWEFNPTVTKIVGTWANGTTNTTLNQIQSCSSIDMFPAKPIRSTPAVYNSLVNNTVFFGSDLHVLFAVDEFGGGGSQAGTTYGRWSGGPLTCPSPNKLPSYTFGPQAPLYPEVGDVIRAAPAIDKKNNLVIVTSYDNTVRAYDIDTGAPAWTKRLGNTTADRSVTTPTVDNGKVYFGALNGKFYALDTTRTGYTDLWTFSAGDAIWSSAAYSNGLLAFGADDETIYVLDAATGLEAWRYRTGGDVRSSPAIWTGNFLGQDLAGGVLYAGGADGILYAFGGSKPPLPDLHVTAINYDLAGAASDKYLPLNGDVLVGVVIHNHGNSSSPATEMKLFIDGALASTQPVMALAPGENATLNYTWHVTPNNHTLRAEVDPAGLSREFDRSNNALKVETPVAKDPPPPPPTPPPTLPTPPPPTNTSKKKAPGPEPMLLASSLILVAFALRSKKRRG